MDSQRYDELHGIKNWDGLLDPLSLDLRTLILDYGDLASAAQRAFNNDTNSKYNGYSRYGKSSFFKGVMLPWADKKYQVTSFIYATAGIDFDLPSPIMHMMSREGNRLESNWMGYVAVSNDEFSKSIGRREICVVWRGTGRTYEWINDILDAMPVSAEPLIPVAGTTTDTPQVMEGWLTIYNTSNPNSKFIKSSARDQLLAQIKHLLAKYKAEKVSITCTGHSLGASLAALSAFDLAANVATPDINVSAFIFGCPQVGNNAFKAKVDELPNLKILRVKNDPDIVPLWPSKILKWIDEKNWVTVPSELQEYVDIGIEILIDSRKSPYLVAHSELIDAMLSLSGFHNLEGMLHTLSGWNGKDGEFDWGLLKRSLGLVNMSDDLSKKEFKIPTSWWAGKNKGMVLDDHGNWVLSRVDPDDHDLPVY